jgi:hypothetical protein
MIAFAFFAGQQAQKTGSTLLNEVKLSMNEAMLNEAGNV